MQPVTVLRVFCGERELRVAIDGEVIIERYLVAPDALVLLDKGNLNWLTIAVKYPVAYLQLGCCLPVIKR